MAIYGNIAEAGLADVLQLLALGRKVGRLTVADGERLGEVFLTDGRISYATVVGQSDRFGEILVKNGLITPAQLKAALDEQRREGAERQLGRVLLESGVVARSDLERFIRLQVEEAVYTLFAWKQGEFSFKSGMRTSQQFLQEPLDAEGLLLEGARRVDEWSQIRKKIPSFDMIYRRTRITHADSVLAGVTAEQKRVLPLLDGTRDVAGVVELTGMSEFEVGKALYGLLMAGFAQLVERRSRVRHLDCRELLAWVVREAEFADHQRCKDAGRHIVDCPTCSERLRRLQVRRTGASAVVEVPVTEPVPSATVERVVPGPEPETPVVPAPAQERVAPRAPPPEVRAPGPPATHPSHPERRRQERRTCDRRTRDRRSGLDRRRGERRVDFERRRVVGATLGQVSPERRRGPRREEDLRTPLAGGLRGGNGGERAGEALALAPAARTPGPLGRTTGPRRLQGIDAPDQEWSVGVGTLRNAGEEPGEDLGPQMPASESAALAEPTVRGPNLPGGATPPAAGAAPAGLAGPARVAAPSQDIEWIVSPQESNEMMRASRGVRRPRDGAPEARARDGDAPVAALPAAPESRAAGAGQHLAGESERAGEAVRLGSFTWGGGEVAAAGRGWPPGSVLDWRALSFRRLAAVVGLAAVAFVAYRAGRVAQRPAVPEAARTVAEARPRSDAAVPAPQPRAQPPGGESRGGAAVPEARRPPQETRQAVAVPAAPQPRAAVPQVLVPQQSVARAAQIAPAAAAAPPVRAEAPPPAPAPTLGIIRGVVRGPGGVAVAGARVSIRGTALSAAADASGAYEIRDVPDGRVTVSVSAEGYMPASADVGARAGTTVAADLALARAAAAEPDRELSDGGWGVVSRADAIITLGGTLGVIEGLGVESIARSAAGARQRVRVVQLTDAGQRIILTETRAGAAVRGAEGPAHVTALRVMPPSEAYPYSTGTVSFGNILITARSTAPVEVLRTLLARMGDAAQWQ